MANENHIKETVKQISSFTNSYTADFPAFLEEMSREHRTLQQSFTRLCLAWIEFCASEDYRYDMRNEDSHSISKTLLEGFKKEMKLDDGYAHPDLPNWLPTV